MSAIIATVSSIGMAVGPPLVYVDQAYSIIKRKDSTGFSWDVCGVLLIANIIRVFFWLGNRFEIPLLVQSLLLILSQLLLLSICLHYSPRSETQSYAPLSPLVPATEPLPDSETGPQDDEPEHEAEIHGGPWKVGSKRPFGFWQWEGYGSYLEFLAGLIVVLGVLQILLGRWMWYIDTLGFVSLTIESTLPIPQFISNYQRRSTYGFRASTLAGWLFGDTFKTAYFFLRHAPIQFRVTAILTVCWDCAVLSQRIRYGTDPPKGTVLPEEAEEARVLQSDEG